jgi:hypothetical protein
MSEKEVEMSEMGKHDSADCRADHPQRPSNSIAKAFRTDCFGKLRLLVMMVVLVAWVLTLVLPILYVLYIICSNSGIKGLTDHIGLQLQPLILAKKASKGTKRYNQIICSAPHNLFMGAQPDRFGGFRALFGRNNIRTVISLNSDKERAGNLWMSPPTETVYSKHSVTFVKFTMNDHAPLTTAVLTDAADSIQEGLQIGDVYVHCKAGQGRSAQAVLAYFIKHEHKTVDQGVSDMKRDRPGITLKTSKQVSKLKGQRRKKAQKRLDFLESLVYTTGSLNATSVASKVIV